MVQAGSIALADLLQADLKTKKRPVLVLSSMPGHGDWLVCGISSKLWQEIAGFDEVITGDDPDFERSGLKNDSLVRLGFLGVVPNAHIAGKLGDLPLHRLAAIKRRLVSHLSKEEA